MFEGGFLQQPPSRVRGRPSHIQLEGFEPGESDDGVLNRYIRATPVGGLHSFERLPSFYAKIVSKNMWPRGGGSTLINLFA